VNTLFARARRWLNSALPGVRFYEPVTIGATIMAILSLYGVYSSVKRGIEVTRNAIQFEQMEESVAFSMKELAEQAEQYRGEAANEADLLRAERKRQLADEADAMRRELGKLAQALEKAEVEYKKAETLNNFLNAFGGDTGSVLAPVLDQVFQFDPPGAASSLRVRDYFEKKLGAPVTPALQGELTTRMFQVTLERAFRDCGVSSENLARTADCVGTELLVLNNKLGAYSERSQATEQVRALIKKSLSSEELKRLLRNRLEHGDFTLDGGASEDSAELEQLADGGAGPDDGGAPESWPGRWSGIAKVVTRIDDIYSDVRVPMELSIAVSGTEVVMTSPGGPQPMRLTLSASNPNVASGEGKSQFDYETGLSGGHAKATSKMVAFLRDGRMYLAIETAGHGHGHFMQHSGKSQTSISTAAMFDRIE
jgi:hypothetical protein